jgi:opacity protein-like surface antigen
MSSNLKHVAQVAGAALLVLSFQLAAASESGGVDDAAETPLAAHLFERGSYEAAFSSGALFSPFIATRHRPTIDYTLTGLQLGYMLGNVKGDGWWRGNFELAVEGFGSGIFDGPGSYIAGGTLWLRYNFVSARSSPLVPYAQAGAGLVSTDIDRGIVGQPFNFNLDLGVGVRYLAGRNWSFSLEYRYQHISNANLGKRNLGLNADGPFLGVSYFF